MVALMTQMEQRDHGLLNEVQQTVGLQNIVKSQPLHMQQPQYQATLN